MKGKGIEALDIRLLGMVFFATVYGICRIRGLAEVKTAFIGKFSNQIPLISF